MLSNRSYYIAVTLIAILLGYLSYQIIRPFISPIAWAIVLSIVFYPVYAFLEKSLKWKPLASVVTVLIILAALIGPFSYLGYLLMQELIALLTGIEGGNFNPMKTFLQHPLVSGVVGKILLIFHISEGDFQKVFIENVTQFGKDSVGMIRSGLGNVIAYAVNFIFMVLSIFFFLGSGPEFLEKVSDYMPFSKRQKERLFLQTKDIVVSTIYGGVVVALVQGIIGGIAYSLLGIPSPVVWGLSTFVTSFIPLVGTFLVWGPLAAYLLIKGFLLKGFILVLVGTLAISSADNVLRPLIIKGKMKMPTLVILFSILGGIKLFGFIGFIMGPLVVALFVSVMDILRYVETQRLADKGKG